MRTKILNEVYIHKKICHQGVIRLYEVFEDSKYLYIVLEYWESMINRRGFISLCERKWTSSRK